MFSYFLRNPRKRTSLYVHIERKRRCPLIRAFTAYATTHICMRLKQQADAHFTIQHRNLTVIG